MSIDKTLRRKGGLTRSRNVLKREERMLQMQKDETWRDGSSPIGLPKTRVLKLTTGKKKKKAKEGEEGAAAPAAAPAAKGGAAGAKGGAAGAKPAAAAKPAAGKPAGKK